METNEQEEVIVDDLETSNEEVAETTEETSAKADKPKRTPQEELEYFEGRAARLRKKLGVDESKPEAPKAHSSDKPNELDMGSIAYLAQMTGLKGKAELALAREYLANGKTVLDLPDNKFFLQDLQALRDSAETANAVPKGKGRSSQTAVTDIDIAVAKFKEAGTLPTDFETRNKVVDAITKKEKGTMFSL